MSVDETAEAILDKSVGVVTFTNGKVYGGEPTITETGLQGIPYQMSEEWTLADLQAMANLWLIKQAVITAMKDFRSSVNGEGGTAFADFAVDRFERAIEALEDTDE